MELKRGSDSIFNRRKASLAASSRPPPPSQPLPPRPTCKDSATEESTGPVGLDPFELLSIKAWEAIAEEEWISRPSFESSRSCSRRDSIDVDPFLCSRSAREYKAGLFLARQALKLSVSFDDLTPRDWIRSSLFAEVHRTPTLSAPSTGTCDDQTLVPSPSSQGSDTGSIDELIDDCYSRTSINRALSSRFRKCKTLFRTAYRRMSGGVLSTQNESGSVGSKERSSMLPSEAQTISISHRDGSRTTAVGSDGSVGHHHDPPTGASSAFSCTPLQGASPKISTSETSSSLRQDERSTQPATPSGCCTEAKLNIVERTPELPSYHRLLRKQKYPPRVNYRVHSDSDTCSPLM